MPLQEPETSTTLVRLEGADVDILLPGAGADFSAYARRLRDGTFPAHDGPLASLASWALVPPIGTRAPERIARGQGDAAVWMLQAMLKRLAALESAPDLEPGQLDGDFGERTEAAVHAFQERGALVMDGVAGPVTLGALEQALARHGITALTLIGAALPRVGIVASDPRKLLPNEDGEIRSFIALCARVGCRPVLVPPCADVLLSRDAGERDAAIAAMAASLDGILGPGGDDVDPAIYGEDNQYSENTNYARDRFEAAFAAAGMAAKAFMFGICRSHQLWNAAAGGTLVQDLQAEGFSSVSQRQSDFSIDGALPFIIRGPDGSTVFENRVRLAPGSQMAAILGNPESILTNSYHHQAVEFPGEGFAVAGIVWDQGTQRGTIEATERWNAITTQFHPEAMLRDADHRGLMETIGRRARIVRMLREVVDPGALLERMRQFPEGTFHDADFAWARDTLPANLR